jgi:hypothetical protein
VWTSARGWSAVIDDPANQVLCETCGRTNAMACPECPSGCGCSTGCSGWRHAEYVREDELNEDRDDVCECGSTTVYECVCD